MREDAVAGRARQVRRTGLLLLWFLLPALLLCGRRAFFTSDGYMEYRAGEAIAHRGAIDLPPELARGNNRYVVGKDGRAYSVFGIGTSVQFAAAVAADRALGRLTGTALEVGEGEGAPGFFSTGANLPVTALIGVTLFALLADLGVAVSAAALAALLSVFGTMALVYATLSFDMPLAILFLLAGTLFFFRACRGGRAVDGALAGLLIGAGLMTRITTAIFLPLLGLHALLAARAHGAGGVRRLSGAAAAFCLPVAAALAGLGWYNWRRFGGALATGYSEALVAYNFDTPLVESLPGLLASPGRSVFVFSPLLLLALAGIPALLRARRLEGGTLLLMALANLLFFAKNRNWANAFVTWGPRFQLTGMLLLAAPLGFWLERSWLDATRRRRLAWAAIFLSAVGLQLAVLAAGFSPPKKDLWSVEGSQMFRSLREFAALVGGGRWGDLMFWWAGPWYGLAPLRALAWGAVATMAASGALLVRELRRAARGGPPA